ncbi:MAG TPA: ABC transporter ATP-binding protein, partial [Candidatus Thermoplasmatota archaeon]|nr:ABC transporter ATP-binding protein [Candidatus Thermoplasmatota archaeon]
QVTHDAQVASYSRRTIHVRDGVIGRAPESTGQAPAQPPGFAPTRLLNAPRAPPPPRSVA